MNEIKTATIELAYEEARLLEDVLIGAHARTVNSPTYNAEDKRELVAHAARLTTLRKRVAATKLTLIQRMTETEAVARLGE
jgi:hypothetical protein